LKKFFVTVACLHPDLIPNEKVMWAPIPFDARHPQPGFRYRAVIVTTPPEIISYYRLNHSIWSLSNNKEASR
jgi:hypothetical protein